MACMVSLVVPTAARAQDAPTLAQIVSRAQAAWEQRPKPALIDFDVTLRGHHKRDDYSRELHVRYKTSDRSTIVTVVRSSGHAPVGSDPNKQRFFPDSAFGFIRFANDAEPDSGTADSPAVIGRVVAVSNSPYDVTLIDQPTMDGRVLDHLALRPRFNPDRFRIRELWVDPQTYRVHQIVAQIPEPFGPIVAHFFITAHYAEYAPYLLIDRVTATGAVRVALFSYSGDGEATFRNYTFPANTTP